MTSGPWGVGPYVLAREQAAPVVAGACAAAA